MFVPVHSGEKQTLKYFEYLAIVAMTAEEAVSENGRKANTNI